MRFKLGEQSFSFRFIKLFSYLYGIIFFIFGIYNIIEHIFNNNITFFTSYSYFLYVLLGSFFLYNGIRTKIKYFYFSIDDITIKYFLSKKEGEIIIFLQDVISTNLQEDILSLKLKNNICRRIDLKKIKNHLNYKDRQRLENKLIELGFSVSPPLTAETD